MKKYINIIAGLLLSSMIATGCSDDFLTVVPPTQETIEDYFNSEARVFEALVAAYDPLQWPDWSMGQYNPINIMSDIMADDIWVGGADKNDNQYWHLMMDYSALPTNCMTGLWTVAYSGVKRSNDVLLYISWNVDKMSITSQNRYGAEARVLRAFYYNWLWKFWGNIPFYTENLTFPYIAPQFSADEVYNIIISDLEEVINLDALPMKASSTELGRVTKAMAYMLYAEMVMYQNDQTRFAKALTFMKEIINSGEYDLLDDFSAIFAESGEWSNESIFEINYKDDNAARSWDNPIYSGGTVLPRLISANGWSDGLEGHDNGWGFCPLRKEAYDMYADGDTRRDATCFDAASKGSYKSRYQDTGYFLEKYAALSGNNADQIADADLNWNNNLRIYRFSETLLNAAELIVRGAGSGNAADYLNRVHNRAGLTDQLEATIDNIIEERHLEFVGEGKRYWDLIRSGKAQQTLTPDVYGYRTNSWSASKKYLPIPQSEIDASQGTLTQNPY